MNIIKKYSCEDCMNAIFSNREDIFCLKHQAEVSTSLICVDFEKKLGEKQYFEHYKKNDDIKSIKCCSNCKNKQKYNDHFYCNYKKNEINKITTFGDSEVKGNNYCEKYEEWRFDNE